MGSKAVTDRFRSSESVCAALTQQRERIVQGIEKSFGPKAAGACRTFVDELQGRLRTDTQAMVAADDAHDLQLGKDNAAHVARDQHLAEVRDRLMGLRQTVSAVFGTQAPALIGFTERTPDDPAGTYRLGEQVVQRLATWKAPPAHFESQHFDAHAWIVELRGPLGQLKQSLTDTASEDRHQDATLTTKHQALDTYDHTFSMTANLASALLAAAGESELAKKLRPSTRKPGQTVAEAADPVDAPAPAPVPAAAD